MKPEEDKYLEPECKHEWVDLYGGTGVSRTNPRVALNAFFCKHCLEIRVKSWSQERFSLSKEFLQTYEEDNGDLTTHG